VLSEHPNNSQQDLLGKDEEEELHSGLLDLKDE